MAPTKILDSHVHLWPSTATSETDHKWMTPDFFLAKRHGITEYNTATSSSTIQPSGFVYVETDRYLSSSNPEIIDADTDSEKSEKLKKWARAPLEELGFLRRVVEKTPNDGDGFESADSQKLRGLVIWAPFHLPFGLFKVYLHEAEDALGPEAWRKVLGYRYLLQGESAASIGKIVENQHFGKNVASIGNKAFDVGIDCHRDGVEALDVVSKLVKSVRKTEGGDDVKFVLNHLCKPDLSTSAWPSFSHWKSGISRLAADSNVYMKLSGSLNEFAPSPTPSSAQELIKALFPLLEHVLQSFGPRRIMFGSDWPVCNVGGPKGEQGNWGLWREVVEIWMEEKELQEGEREYVWWRTGLDAYGLEEL